MFLSDGQSLPFFSRLSAPGYLLHAIRDDVRKIKANFLKEKQNSGKDVIGDEKRYFQIEEV